MIELVPAEHDDVAFVSLVKRIINGAIAAMGLCDVFVVHIDNWFDHKWLGWRTGKGEGLRVPPFTLNRVCSEKRFVRDADKSAWTSAGLPMPLHIAGRPSPLQPIDRYSKNATFIWDAGNTATNKVGSLMFYRSGADDYAWYASLKNGNEWAIADEFQITRRELLSFEARGRQLELAHA
jgi:hypothetical protein